MSGYSKTTLPAVAYGAAELLLEPLHLLGDGHATVVDIKMKSVSAGE